MKNAAAFRASFSDWKLIRTRCVVQVVFEVPISEADTAYQALGGMPNAAEERWFGIARLNPGDGSERVPGQQHNEAASPSLSAQAPNSGFDPRDRGHDRAAIDVRREAERDPGNLDVPASRPRKVAPEKRLAQQAGICCADPVFWKWLAEKRGLIEHLIDESVAAGYVRHHCGVTSRSKIIPNSDTNAALRWNELYFEFLIWKHHPDLPSPEQAQ